MDTDQLKLLIMGLLFSKALVHRLHFEPREMRTSLDIIKEKLKLNIEAHSRASSSVPTSLNHYEYQVYSQNGEDGIIAELFNKRGTTNKFFVDIFGAGSGVDDNNNPFVLVKGWSGLWIEGDSSRFKIIHQKFGFLIGRSLKMVNTTIKAENIESILRENRVPLELDLLSIEIDGNNFCVWNTISWFMSRLVMVDFNAILSPNPYLVIKYNLNFKHIRYTSYFVPSLEALERLGTKKGYALVGCESKDVNALLVRSDLITDKSKDHLMPVTSIINRQIVQLERKACK